MTWIILIFFVSKRNKPVSDIRIKLMTKDSLISLQNVYEKYLWWRWCGRWISHKWTVCFQIWWMETEWRTAKVWVNLCRLVQFHIFFYISLYLCLFISLSTSLSSCLYTSKSIYQSVSMCYYIYTYFCMAPLCVLI